MTNHADLIAALRIPMDVTLRNGAPELDEYDEQRKAAADALEAVWAEATAAAYKAAAGITTYHYNTWNDKCEHPLSSESQEIILGLTHQSARDWLAAHDAEVYRRWQEDMRERAAKVAYRWWFDGNAAIETSWAIRAIPIKEKDDE